MDCGGVDIAYGKGNMGITTYTNDLNCRYNYKVHESKQPMSCD